MGDSCKEVVVMEARPDVLDALAILRVYFAELISRYQRRPATPEEITAEITAEMLEDPSIDLQPPTGRFLVAFQGRQPVGCIGFRRRSDTVAAVTRMFVIEEARRRGIGVRLLRDLETIVRAAGFTRLELDTRDDLVEARRLYLRAGFAEVPAFSAAPYAECSAQQMAGDDILAMGASLSGCDEGRATGAVGIAADPGGGSRTVRHSDRGRSSCSFWCRLACLDLRRRRSVGVI